jgi:hypothetical protein
METKYLFGSIGSKLCSTTMTLICYGKLKKTGPIGLQDQVSEKRKDTCKSAYFELVIEESPNS